MKSNIVTAQDVADASKNRTLHGVARSWHEIAKDQEKIAKDQEDIE